MSDTIIPLYLTSDKKILENLHANYSEGHRVTKRLLQETLTNFKLVMKIPSGHDFCYCGTVNTMANVIGKDYRDSNLLYLIAEEYLRCNDWSTAILNVVGSKAMIEFYDERTLYSKENIISVLERERAYELNKKRQEKFETLKSDDAFISEVIKEVKHFLEISSGYHLPADDYLECRYTRGLIPVMIVYQLLPDSEK